jgi:CubicO group peptidase (beta-lactamase class C family)
MSSVRVSKRALAICLIGAVLLSVAGSVTAQEASSAPLTERAIVSTPGQGPTDPAEMGAFLDELLGRQMAEHHIAGAAVSVVKDGKLFFARGYGYADVDERVRVDAEQTAFRIGSVSKLFTWTAVMQLVEQGKLDLDTDVNEYLDFRIPDTHPQPITLRHLLTHTSGLEDWLLGAVTSDPDDVVPAREWLTSHAAARVRPPADGAGYSNYNAALAGYIVERASGQSYDQYVQDRILDPLGMTHSTARSLVPPELRGRVSVGYTYVGGAFRAFPAYHVQPAGLPSGGLQASATDMARFMIAHLQGGHYSDAHVAEARILKEATARQMHGTLYTPDPRLQGTAYGFFDMSDNGQRTLGHTGYLPPMHSLLLLLPDRNLGMFVSYNSAGAGELTAQHLGFQRAFFDHYYSAPTVGPRPPPADFGQRAGRYVGSYRYASAPYTTLARVGALYGYTVEISDPGDGTLLATLEGLSHRFAEVEPLYFRQVDGPFAIVFRADDRGRITRLDTDIMPQYSAVKLDWYETPGFHRALLQGFVLAFLSVLPVAAIRLLRSRRRGGDRGPSRRGARAADWIFLGIGALNLLFVAGTFRWVMQPSELHTPLPVYRIVLGLGLLSAALTAGALGYTARAWQKGNGGIAIRGYYTLLTVTAVAFVWFMDYWNLLGWRY